MPPKYPSAPWWDDDEPFIVPTSLTELFFGFRPDVTCIMLFHLGKRDFTMLMATDEFWSEWGMYAIIDIDRSGYTWKAPEEHFVLRSGVPRPLSPPTEE